MSLFQNENPVLGNATQVNDNTYGAVKPQILEYINVVGLVAASTSLDVAIVPAGETWQIVGVSATFGTASSSGTADLVTMAGTTAVASGTTVLTGTMSLAGTANTPVNGTLVSTGATTVPAGSRIGVKLAGTLTSLVNGLVQIRFKRV